MWVNPQKHRQIGHVSASVVAADRILVLFRRQRTKPPGLAWQYEAHPYQELTNLLPYCPLAGAEVFTHDQGRDASPGIFVDEEMQRNLRQKLRKMRRGKDFAC